MSKLIISSFEEFQSYTGRELGVSDYHQITQAQINLFADATLDHQWIHTDPERAAKESPYGATIAHGYLNLSILPYLWEQIVEVQNNKMLVNYGIEKLKFNQPVKVNDSVRVRAKLNSIVNLRGTSKAEIDIVLEIKDNPKPAFQASIIFLYHFI
jgi:acyl dehydratase